MSGLRGQRISLGQENGPDVELIGWGDEWYADYETPAGYSVIYDDGRGLFCYATLDAGRFESTGIPASEAPPPGLEPHARESAEVRQQKVSAMEARRGPGGAAAGKTNQPDKEKEP